MFSPGTDRIAFSFPDGTFKLERLLPELWETDEEDGTALVALDQRWEHLLRGLAGLGLLMASASAGPVSLAAAVTPRFEPVPDSAVWVCLESGLELCPADLGGALAVLETHRGQQLISLQFYDRDGEGCLKLLATNRTNLAAFETLVRRHACPRRALPFGGSTRSTTWNGEPDAETVRSLWSGLRRTLPETSFPGMKDVSRQRALVAAGPEHAWPVQTEALPRLLETMIELGAPIHGGVRNAALFLPAGFCPQRWGLCECGMTFFADSAQLTLRKAPALDAWAVRFTEGADEILSLEIYDGQRRFCASFGLRPEASEIQRVRWNDRLRALAC